MSAAEKEQMGRELHSLNVAISVNVVIMLAKVGIRGYRGWWHLTNRRKPAVCTWHFATPGSTHPPTSSEHGIEPPSSRG
jgi:hypothetical protein